MLTLALAPIKTEEQLAKTDAQLARIDAKLDKLSDMYGGMGNNQGRVAEEFFSTRSNAIRYSMAFNLIS
jgi:hypothetical protein